MNLKEVHKVFFLGIGGIGMSAIARLFHRQGKEVAGYDRTCTALTLQLEEEGIAVHYTDDVRLIPQGLDLAVYTPAIPHDLHEFVFLSCSGTPMLKRSEVLGMLSSDVFTVAVAGTHGKTSITAMLSHILMQSGYSFTGFVGGVMKDYHSNLIQSGTGNSIVVEADEYDRSFHTLRPDIAMISAIDPDHLDIYGSFEQLVSDYRLFADGIKPGGTLLAHRDLKWQPGSYFLREYGRGAEFSILSTVQDGYKARLRFKLADELTDEFLFSIPGRHNQENALAAAALAFMMGVASDRITAALSLFTGVARRFDIVFQDGQVVYVDDYAHHPRELQAAITAAREYFPGKRVIGVFQPHLYSRTRDLAEGFAGSLDLLDEAYLLDIYPARELPIPGVNAAMIAGLMKKSCPVVSRDYVCDYVATMKDVVFLTLGAGDIDLIAETLKQVFVNRAQKEGGHTA